MNKYYLKPQMKIMLLQHQCMICTSDTDNEVRRVTTSNTGINYSGGGSGPARTPHNKGIDYEW